jgi:hypothetical protein
MIRIGVEKAQGKKESAAELTAATQVLGRMADELGPQVQSIAARAAAVENAVQPAPRVGPAVARLPFGLAYRAGLQALTTVGGAPAVQLDQQ